MVIIIKVRDLAVALEVLAKEYAAQGHTEAKEAAEYLIKTLTDPSIYDLGEIVELP